MDFVYKSKREEAIDQLSGDSGYTEEQTAHVIDDVIDEAINNYLATYESRLKEIRGAALDRDRIDGMITSYWLGYANGVEAALIEITDDNPA